MIALAVFFGLRFCQMKGFTIIEIVSDALNVIKAISCVESDLSMKSAVFDEIRCFKHSFVEITWRKIARRSNNAAHYVAKAALRSTVIRFWKEDGPPWLIDIVMAEKSSR